MKLVNQLRIPTKLYHDCLVCQKRSSRQSTDGNHSDFRLFSIRGLKMELFPDFDLDLVTISMLYPGAAHWKWGWYMQNRLQGKDLGFGRNQGDDFLLPGKMWGW